MVCKCDNVFKRWSEKKGTYKETEDIIKLFPHIFDIVQRTPTGYILRCKICAKSRFVKYPYRR